MLPSGTVIDTAAPGAAERFAAAEPELAAGLAEIRDEIRADAELSERIRRKFEIKNTTGYRLCAFLDADEPLEIFRRLLVGSEGTLAFIAEAVFETVPLPAATTARLDPLRRHRRRRSRRSATSSPPARRAVELMVAPALIVAANIDPRHARSTGRSCRPSRRRCWSSSAPTTRPSSTRGEARGRARCSPGRELIRGPEFTRDPETIELSWRVREGLHGLVGQPARRRARR